MFCYKCGKETNKDSIYCSNCGAKLSEGNNEVQNETIDMKITEEKTLIKDRVNNGTVQTHKKWYILNKKSTVLILIILIVALSIIGIVAYNFIINSKPIAITNIELYNTGFDGSIVKKGTAFAVRDTKYINCDFNAHLTKADNGEPVGRILIKLLGWDGRLLSYSDGSQNQVEQGYTTGFDYREGEKYQFGYGHDSGIIGFLGTYTIEFWYNNEKVKTVHFKIE